MTVGLTRGDDLVSCSLVEPLSAGLHGGCFGSKRHDAAFCRYVFQCAEDCPAQTLTLVSGVNAEAAELRNARVYGDATHRDHHPT